MLRGVYINDVSKQPVTANFSEIPQAVAMQSGGNKLPQIISTIYQSTQCHIPQDCNFHLQTDCNICCVISCSNSQLQNATQLLQMSLKTELLCYLKHFLYLKNHLSVINTCIIL
jgi:hypothetical protein